MEKINFENLPSTNTPLNADILNGMQNKIEKSANYIGSTQPSTGEKVWIKTGKNLIDYNSVMWGSALFNDGSINYDSNNWVTTQLIAVNPNTIYIFSHELGTRFGRIGFYNSDKTFISLISDSNVTAFTTPSNAKYVAISVYDANEITTSREGWLQLEQNSTKTTYEPYVEKEILVKNNNGMFEKFYSEKLADSWKRAVLSNYVQGDVKYFQIGKIVIVVFDDFKVINDITENFVNLATGLPPSREYTRTALVEFVNVSGEGFRIAITTDGRIINHYSTPVASANNFYGNLIYIAK